MSEKAALYTFKTKTGEIRKALDLTALNGFIDTRLLRSNPILNDELNKTTIEEYRGKIAWQILMELNLQVKKDLGLIEEQTAEPETAPEASEEPEPEPEAHAHKPASKPSSKPANIVKEPKQEVEDMLTEESKDDDVIVLD